MLTDAVEMATDDERSDDALLRKLEESMVDAVEFVLEVPNDDTPTSSLPGRLELSRERGEDVIIAKTYVGDSGQRFVKIRAIANDTRRLQNSLKEGSFAPSLAPFVVDKTSVRFTRVMPRQDKSAMESPAAFGAVRRGRKKAKDTWEDKLDQRAKWKKSAPVDRNPHKVGKKKKKN